MSLINSIEISNEPESSQISEIVQSFIKKLTNANLSDKSTDEVIKSLSSSFESTLRAFESKLINTNYQAVWNSEKI